MAFADDSTAFLVFTANSFVENRYNSNYQLQYLLGVFCALIWAKTILLFRTTSSVGPKIKILIYLTQQVLSFLVFWSMIILTFVVLGMCVFFQVDEFRSVGAAVPYLVFSVLGNWDISIFRKPISTLCVYKQDDIANLKANYLYQPFCNSSNEVTSYLTDNDQNLALIFIAVFILLNVIIILNLVIAKLSSIYELLTDYSRGLFYEAVVL
jgi:hypothetical protein